MAQLGPVCCGAIPDNSTPSVSPLNGWFWPFPSNFDPTNVFPHNSTPTGGRNRPLLLPNADFINLYWNAKELTIDWEYDDGTGHNGSFIATRFYFNGTTDVALVDEVDLLGYATMLYDDTDYYSYFAGVPGTEFFYLYFDQSKILHGGTDVDVCMALSLDGVHVYSHDPAGATGGGSGTDFGAGNATILGQSVAMFSDVSGVTVDINVTITDTFAYAP